MSKVLTHGVTETKKPVAIDRWRLIILCTAVCLTATAYSLHVDSFLVVKESVLALVLAPLTLLTAIGSAASPHHATRPAWSLQGVWIFLPFCVLAALPLILGLAIVFPKVPAFAYREQIRMTVLLITVIVTFDLLRSANARHHVVTTFLGTSVIAAMLAYLQRADRIASLLPIYPDLGDPVYTVFGNSGLLGGYLAMALPFFVHRAVHETKPLLSAAGLLAVLPALLLTSSRAAWLAAFVGVLIVLPIRRVSWRRLLMLTILLSTVTAAVVLAFPHQTRDRVMPGAPGVQDSIHLRKWFWDGTVRMFAANPVTGVGLGNYQYASPEFLGDALWKSGDTISIVFGLSEGETHAHNQVHTLHAHNELLELAAETGLIGIALAVWMLLRIWRWRGSQTPEWGGIAAFSVFACFHFPWHSAPHALMFLLFIGMLAARSIETENYIVPRPFNRVMRLPAYTVPVSILLAGLVIWDVLLPNRALFRADVQYLEGRPSIEAYETAIDKGAFHPQPHARLANVLILQGRLNEAAQHLDQSLKGMDTGDLHLARGYVAMSAGDRELAVRHLRAATHRWPSNRDAWAYLIQASNDEERDVIVKEAARWLSDSGMPVH